jgi:hypothetical protein
MVKLFLSFAAAIVLSLFSAPLNTVYAGVVYDPGYPPYFYHYHRHDHFHYYGYPYGPPPGWYPPYAVEYGYRVYPRVHKRKVVRPRTPKNPNWFYCKSPWRVEARIAAARDWWPYYAPRATRPLPVPAGCTK